MEDKRDIAAEPEVFLIPDDDVLGEITQPVPVPEPKPKRESMTSKNKKLKNDLEDMTLKAQVFQELVTKTQHEGLVAQNKNRQTLIIIDNMLKSMLAIINLERN